MMGEAPPAKNQHTCSGLTFSQTPRLLTGLKHTKQELSHTHTHTQLHTLKDITNLLLLLLLKLVAVLEGTCREKSWLKSKVVE